jgi:hypothetical protein
MVLIVWELIPTSVIIFLFRLRICQSSRQETIETSSLNPGLTRSVFIESKRDLLDQSTESQSPTKKINREQESGHDTDTLLEYDDEEPGDIYTISNSINN